ncbi:MAG: endonuclease MutS2 [Clostridiales bacterium]|jgi:DNA mismatch repair protein MutS2|nr:endonuclease MutS2 [Clostridiales bacterium]
MNSKSLRVLEFDKIIKRLTSKAISTMGKERTEKLTPMNDIIEIERAQQETSESALLITQKGSLPMGGVRDIRESVKRAKAGGALSIEELLNTGDFIYVCRKVAQYYRSVHSSALSESLDGASRKKADERANAASLLGPIFTAISVPAALEKEISRCVVNAEELSDDASPKLSEIRRGIKVAHDRVREQLNNVIRSQAYKNMLQDAVITIRGDRYCVPVKQEYRASFNGIAHDQSSTGATVFMEPIAVVQLNNRIKELRSDEKDEIDAILRRISADVAEESETLLSDIELLTDLDFAFAKGELSLSMKAVEPDYNARGFINIKKGRHPLLQPETVVPTDIYLGKDFTILLITGPNTGGKTVALKTVGLFCLMGQAGLHIPAFDHSELTVFDEVFADIGDEQSIEQSLSTFSSHMSNIVGILRRVNANSLVLLDELGAGTDPTEGAALAAAILDYMHDRKIRTAVTTHYSELKVYALSTEGVENASCEFDVETLRPTYKLLIGIPGKSNAFAISSRLGLPDHIINNAKEILSHEDIRFEDVISDLEINKRTVEMERERAEAYRREAETLKNQFEARQAKLAEQREKILLDAKENARNTMRRAKDEADRLLKEYQKQLRISQKGSEVVRQELRDKTSELDSEAEAAREGRNLRPLPKHLKNGDRVYIHSINQSGSIINASDANGEVMVQAGIMKIKVHISNLSLDESKPQSKPEAVSGFKNIKSSAGKGLSMELDLRGMNMDEGVSAADKYLDSAYLAGLTQVTLIHGKGTGVLRSAIQNMLKNRPRVKNYRLGRFGEGEDGVTIVEFE